MAKKTDSKCRYMLLVTLSTLFAFFAAFFVVIVIMNPCKIEGNVYEKFSILAEGRGCSSELGTETLLVVETRSFSRTGKERHFCVNLASLGYQDYVFDDATLQAGPSNFRHGEHCNSDDDNVDLKAKQTDAVICTAWDAESVNTQCEVRFIGKAKKSLEKNQK